MKIQLHLSHTIVECENKFLNVAWQLQTTIDFYDVDFINIHYRPKKK